MTSALNVDSSNSVLGTQVRRSLNLLKRINRYPIIPIGIMTMMILFAIFAPLFATHDPYNGYLGDREIPPFWSTTERSSGEVIYGSGEHILGTDQQGRDLWSRIIYGARISMIIVVIVSVIGSSIGTTLGILAAWYGKHIDEVVMRLVDLTLAMPFILVALVTVIVFGQSMGIVIFLLAVFSWNGHARQIRADALSIKNQDYVNSALVAGASSKRIMYRHIFPGVINTLLVVSSLRIGSLILSEAILSYLGAGIPPPTPAWGLMVADGRQYLDSSWWIAFFPGCAIFLLVLSGNFIGDWLRDKLDPRLRQYQ